MDSLLSSDTNMHGAENLSGINERISLFYRMLKCSDCPNSFQKSIKSNGKEPLNNGKTINNFVKEKVLKKACKWLLLTVR